MLYWHPRQPRPASDAVLRAMFAARKAVFVDLLKWDVPVIDGRFEVDQFDDAQAVYIVLTDKRGDHLGSVRLLQRVRPHILDSFYSELCEGGPPRGPDIVEVTRFCLDRRLRAAYRRQVRDALIMALAEHAVTNGIRMLSAVAALPWMQQVLRFGWKALPLGAPRAFDGAVLVAVGIEIDAETPSRLRTARFCPAVTHIQYPRFVARG